MKRLHSTFELGVDIVRNSIFDFLNRCIESFSLAENSHSFIPPFEAGLLFTIASLFLFYMHCHFIILFALGASIKKPLSRGTKIDIKLGILVTKNKIIILPVLLSANRTQMLSVKSLPTHTLCLWTNRRNRAHG